MNEIRTRITLVYSSSRISNFYRKLNINNPTRGLADDDTYRLYYDIFDRYPENVDIAKKELENTFMRGSSNRDMAMKKLNKIINDNQTQNEEIEIFDTMGKFKLEKLNSRVSVILYKT